MSPTADLQAALTAGGAFTIEASTSGMCTFGAVRARQDATILLDGATWTFDQSLNIDPPAPLPPDNSRLALQIIGANVDFECSAPADVFYGRILVRPAGSLEMRGCTVDLSADSGTAVSVQENSTLRFTSAPGGNGAIKNASGSGIYVSDSDAFVNFSTIEGNGTGVSLFGGSFRISGGVVIQGNGNGIFGRRTDIALSGGSPPVIQTNNGIGVWLQDNSAMAAGNGSIINNVGDGVFLETGSGIRVTGNGNVSGNGGRDIVCNGKSTWEAVSPNATVGQIFGCNQ